MSLEQQGEYWNSENFKKKFKNAIENYIKNVDFLDIFYDRDEYEEEELNKLKAITEQSIEEITNISESELRLAKDKKEILKIIHEIISQTNAQQKGSIFSKKEFFSEPEFLMDIILRLLK